MTRTKDQLAAELRKIAERSQPANRALYVALADRAETGEFDDYGAVHGCGPTALYNELVSAGFNKFAQRVASGEFDATKEESDEWARSPDGQEAAKQLTPEMRELLGMDLLQ